MSKENVVLLHGRFPERIDGALIADIPTCDPNHPGNWMGWTKQELIKRGYDADCPVIRDVWKSAWEEWKRQLDAVRVDEGTTLVGWSQGGYAVLRYLGETGKKVKRVILVAPGAPKMDRDEPEKLFPNEEENYEYPITPALTAQIRDRVEIIVSNDFDFILRAVDFYEKTLNANVIRLDGLGHFSFLIPTLPELLEHVLA
ncbi:MAG: alpha/beta fold hydrolase [Candidatus Uhrbacteria bacterium]